MHPASATMTAAQPIVHKRLAIVEFLM